MGPPLARLPIVPWRSTTPHAEGHPAKRGHCMRPVGLQKGRCGAAGLRAQTSTGRLPFCWGWAPAHPLPGPASAGSQNRLSVSPPRTVNTAVLGCRRCQSIGPVGAYPPKVKPPNRISKRSALRAVVFLPLNQGNWAARPHGRGHMSGVSLQPAALAHGPLRTAHHVMVAHAEPQRLSIPTLRAGGAQERQPTPTIGSRARTTLATGFERNIASSHTRPSTCNRIGPRGHAEAVEPHGHHRPKPLTKKLR